MSPAGRPLPRLRDPSRTIALGRRVSNYLPIMRALGIGESHPTTHSGPPELRPLGGWFISKAEEAQLLAEMAQRQKARENKWCGKRRDARRAARRSEWSETGMERAKAIWRQECADPLAPEERRTPHAAWEFAARIAFDLAPDEEVPEMPLETPPVRLPRSAVVVELSGRRDGGEHGRAETAKERAARLTRERRAGKSAPSAAAAGAGGRR